MGIGFLLLACGVLTRTAASADAPARVQATAAAPADTLFVVRRGWHIDIGFAVADLATPLNSVAAGFPGARYLLFGFGDRRYLTAAHRNAPVLLEALWPGPGMLLATALLAAPATAFDPSQVIELQLPHDRLLRAQAFVWQALTEHQKSALLANRDGRGGAIGIPGPYEGSAFFDSKDTYSAAHTCNTWAAQALQATEIPVHSHGVVFAGQVWGQVRREARRVANQQIPPSRQAPQSVGGDAEAPPPRQPKPTT